MMVQYIVGGGNIYGQLGDTTTSQSYVPVQVHGVGNVGFLADIEQISVGSSHVCALKNDGTAYCWGYNWNGQLGDNTTTQRNTPVQVHGVGDVGYLTDVAQISSGTSQTCATKNDGTVYCWGWNNYGELGDNTTSQRNTPVQVHGVGDVGYLTDVTQVITDNGFTCALKNDGTAYCWGLNGSGRLGDNTSTQRNTPVQVHGVGNVGYLTDVLQISTGNDYVCAVKNDGTVYCWGANSNGQLGDNTTTQRNTPVQVHGAGNVGLLTSVVQISTGLSHTCVLINDSSVYCWGYNGYGQLGDNTTSQRNTPIQVVGISVLDNFSNVLRMATGLTTNHNCLIRTDNTLYCWGLNNNGELGDNTTVKKYTPTQVHGVSNVGYLTGITQVSIGSFYVCALKNDGTVYCWGNNIYGQLGDNTTSQRNTPVQVHGVGNVGYLTDVVQISSGSSKTCATKNDGTVYCWGYNASGQLGDNTTTQRNTPVQVHGVGDVGYLTDVAKVSSGQSHTCAVKTDNTLYCWGYNSNGQLGDNTATTRNTPVQVHGVGNVGFLTDVSQISTGGFHTCAVKTDGTAYCWGYNGNGHLGDNTSTQRNTPVQVKGVGNVGFLTDISQISAGQEHTCSFKTDGTAYCWGLNGYGRLGDNTTTQRNTPVQVHGVGDSGFLTDVMDISSSYWGSCAVSTNNIGYCWGYNGNGNLGDGTNINSNTPVSINEYLVPVGFIHLVTYPSSGTFLSSTINLSGDSAFSTLTFSTTLNSQTITIKARSSATSDFSSAPAWEGCSTITSGNALSTGGCVTDGHQYIQYQATLSTNDTAVTPTLDSVVINYNQYNSEGNLISSPYDTSSDANLISRISWTASATSSNEIVKFQVRSSGDGITWSNWCGPSNTCDGNDYFLYSNNGVTLDVNHPLRDGVNDRYLQYKTVLSSGGAATPIVSEVNVQYVVNAPPEFDATYGTNGVTAIQITDDQDSDYGKVSISYRIRDPDGSTGTITPGYVTPSFEYNIGGGWVAIDQSALSAGDTSNKAVDDNNYATYTAVWSATTSIAGVFSSTTQLRVTVNDNEAANNNGTGVSATFVLDTKSPTYTTIILDSSENNIIMSSADDSQFQYRLCNDNTFPSSDTEGNSCVWSALSGNFSSSSIPWLPGKDVDGNETVYIEIKDIAGNYIYHSIVAPALPSNFDFKDISNTLINSYREFLSWGVFQATTSSSFSSYKLYHSTDGVNYSVLTDITNPSINYYHHIISTGTSSTHFYKLAVEDTDGDISDYTTIMSDVPNGQGSSDTTPPTIEPASILLPGANLKNTSVQVTFTTDELAKGEVEYRPNGSSTWVSVPSVSYVLSHSIYIQNLSPNTTYNLRLRAEDVSGNVSSYISGPDFSTVGGPIITGVNAINLTDNSVTIFWNTSTSSDSYVYYSINQNIIPSISEWSATNVACATSICQHKIDISGLTPGTRYYYYVKSTDGEGNETIDTNGGSYYTFSTTLDVNPPEISNISTPVISSNAGVIIWQTDEPSTSQVEWGTSPGVLTRTTVLDSTKSNYHVVSLSKDTIDTNSQAQTLTPSTPYYFKVFSSDAAGNTSSSSEQTFSTTKDGEVVIVTQYVGGGGGSPSVTLDTTAPVITSVDVGNVGAFSTEVKVVTNEDVRVFIDYGETKDFTSTEGSKELSKSKIIKLKKLQTGTDYNYRVTVVDNAGNVAVYPDSTFKTLFISEMLTDSTFLDKATDIQGKIEELIESALPSLSPPSVSTPSVVDVTESSATVIWKTNIKSISSLDYASDEEYKENNQSYVLNAPSSPDKQLTHTIELANLKPNTKYHIQAKSHVFPQVVGKSQDLTFITKAPNIQGSIVERKTDSFRTVWTSASLSSSIVDYRNVRTGESNRKVIKELVKHHDVLVTGLTPGTTYEVSISGTTANGNTIEAREPFIITMGIDNTPPQVASIKVNSALVSGRTDRAQTVISWNTDEPATSIVSYEEGSGSSDKELINKIEETNNYTTNHAVIVPVLKPGTIYRIQVASKDEAGNLKKLPMRTIITPQHNESVVDVIFKNFEDTFKVFKQVR